MASIDYQEARKEISKIFSRNDGNGRKIIFWYDAPANFQDDLSSDTLDFCRLLVCDKNEFAIKKIIEHEDTESNILVYIPSEKPRDSENWLLDILMYSEEYYADTVALTMRRLGLTNTDLRKIIERHAKFFDNEARNKKLGHYVAISDAMSGDDLKIGMMSVLVKAVSRSIESILIELVFDDAEQTKYKELKKYGFEEYLWDSISAAYNYEGDQKIEVLTKRFVFTAMLEQKAEFDKMPSFYSQFVIENAGKTDAKFFVDRLKTDARYEALQLGLALDLKIEPLIDARDMTCVQESDVFECVDNYIIRKIADGLGNGSFDYDAFERIISYRYNSMWYEKHKYEYQMLVSMIRFARLLDKPIMQDMEAIDYIRAYTDSYYEIDTEYRHVCTNYKRIVNPILEIEVLVDRVEMMYQERFLNVLGREFSEALAKQNDWNFVGVEMSNRFYQRIQRNQFKKMFVIISDGFRYEVGKELCDALKVDPILKGTADLEFAVSPMPSETRFGMAALLPHQTITYANKGVFVDCQPTSSTSARNAVLQAKNPAYVAISYEEINGFSRNDLRSFMADKSIVYIYHNVIDNTGENNESKVFEEVDTAITEIISLIKKLYNNLQISNFYITADHGFLYRRNTIMESQKYSNVVSLKPTEASKRYVITDDSSISIPYTTEFEVLDGQYRVITPFGYDLFKTQGSGLQYVHGGASLQEIIVPVIRISEMRSKVAKEPVGPVGIRLKSITRKITNRSFSLDFEQYEKVEEKKQPVACETFMTDDAGNVVSGVYRFVANSTSDDPQARVTKIRFTLSNIEFDRNKRYFLVLRNEDRPEEYIEREQFTIDILGFKMF